MVDFIWDNIFKNSGEEKKVAQILKENILFRNLSKGEIRFVEKIIHVRTYRAGEFIFRQGEVGVGMYIIVKGSVNIVGSRPNGENPEDSQVVITRLVAGDFFGELSLVEENGLRSAACTAHEDSVLIGFFKPDLMEIVNRNPATGVKITLRLAEVLGHRLKETTEKITQMRRQQKGPKSYGTSSEPNQDP